MVEDRLVIWNPNFAELYEVQGFRGQDEVVIRRINNLGIEFSKLNDVAEFNGEVYVATTQGLFTKSLEGFWDDFPEGELSSTASDFINEFK